MPCCSDGKCPRCTTRCARPDCNHLRADHHQFKAGDFGVCLVELCPCADFLPPVEVTP